MPKFVKRALNLIELLAMGGVGLGGRVGDG